MLRLGNYKVPPRIDKAPWKLAIDSSIISTLFPPHTMLSERGNKRHVGIDRIYQFSFGRETVPSNKIIVISLADVKMNYLSIIKYPAHKEAILRLAEPQ